eukprot:c25464_g1_i1 orf=388-630(-)
MSVMMMCNNCDDDVQQAPVKLLAGETRRLVMPSLVQRGDVQKRSWKKLYTIPQEITIWKSWIQCAFKRYEVTSRFVWSRI